MEFTSRTFIIFLKILMICNLSVSENRLEEFILRDRNNAIPLFSMNLIGHCFAEKAETIVLFGNWSTNLLDLQYKTTKIVQIVGIEERESISDYTNIVKIYKIDPDSELFIPYPVQKFVIAEVSPSILRLVLHKIKNSIWWNVRGFFIVQNIHVYNSCENAYALMQIVWEFNILSVVFLCHDSKSGLNLYTFNPYNEDAPEVWKKVAALNYGNDVHTLTLFNRPYDLQSPSACEALNFRKTSNLYGYPINLCTRRSTSRLRSMYNEINEAIWTKLNASVNVTEILQVGIVDNSGLPNFATKDVLEGDYDGFLGPDFERDMWQNEINTFMTSGICYVTNKEQLSFVEQLSEVMPTQMVLIVLALGLTMTIIFKYMLKASFTKVAIDVLRVVTRQSTLRQPVSTPSRVIFLYIVFNFMWVSSDVESNLRSILTVSHPMRATVTTEQEMINQKYKIHSRYYFEQFIAHRRLIDRTIQVNNVSDCLDAVGADDKNACLDDCTVINFHVKESEDIHIESMEPKRFHVLVYRDDFPLLERVATIYYRLMEHGLIEKYSLNQKTTLQKSKTKNSDNFKRFTIHQIKFVVYFMVISYIFATLIFFLELCIERKKK